MFDAALLHNFTRMAKMVALEMVIVREMHTVTD